MKKKLIAIVLVIITILASFTGCGKTPTLQGQMGIDVSAYQGEIDWAKVKEHGVKFAMIRCGYRTSAEGEIHIDKRFFDNIEGATNAGIDVGLYFFSQATNKEEAIEEARVCIGLANYYDVKYQIAFDMEPVDDGGRISGLSKDEKTQIAQAFCKEVEESGLAPMIYGNNNWLANEYDLTKLQNYDIWLADYDNKPNGDIDYKIWQYSQDGKVQGIDHKVDLNLMVK